jgi:hypothetical protein
MGRLHLAGVIDYLDVADPVAPMHPVEPVEPATRHLDLDPKQR